MGANVARRAGSRYGAFTFRPGRAHPGFLQVLSVVGRHRVRLVTHLDVDDAGTEVAADVLRRVLTA